MRHGPTTENLLETARKVLRETLLPQLPRSAAYQALMVANAMAIASRRIAAGDRPEREARGRLAAFYGAPDAGLEELERRLVADIRSGALDRPGERRDAAFDHLWRTACDRAAESNPKALRFNRI
jgi:hypothetical protein